VDQPIATLIHPGPKTPGARIRLVRGLILLMFYNLLYTGKIDPRPAQDHSTYQGNPKYYISYPIHMFYTSIDRFITEYIFANNSIAKKK
jgi:hypothetical protein